MRNTKESDMKRFTEYLTKALAKRKKCNQIMLIRSGNNFVATKQLYDCGGKKKVDFERLMASQSPETAEIVQDIITLWGIKDIDSLTKWREDINKNAAILVKLLASGRKKLTDEEFSSIVNAGEIRDKKGDAYLMMIMYEFALSADGEKMPVKDIMPEFLEIIHPRDVARLYRMLLLTLAPDTVKPKKGKAKDSKPEPEPEPEQDADSDNTKYSAQIEELRAELESAYIRLNASEENFERFQQESAELAVVDVLAKMNSHEAGQLLDQFAKSEQTLKQLSMSGYTVPKELSSVSLCVRMFMRTMRNVFMISPVHVIGEKLTLTLEQAERYDYSGSDFDGSDEIKNVEVISPGWRYGKEIFSLPKVIECRE